MIHIQDLETPIVLVDEDKLKANILRMQKKADKAGVYLRPHIKTHKSKYIADLQMKAGAIGVTASKSSEAAVFIEHGIRSVTLAYPLVERRKIRRLLELAKLHICQLNFICDSRYGFDTIKDVCHQSRFEAAIFLKIDVGLNRCGFDPDNKKVLKMARVIHNDKYLRLAGLLAHEGNSYGAENAKKARKFCKNAIQVLRALKYRIEQEYIPVPDLSIGSTPGALATKRFRAITEIRPGNYVFMDRTPIRLGLAKERDVALTVTSTIVSENKNYYICDAGSKILSSDTGGHGKNNIEGFGLVFPMNTYPDTSKNLLLEKLSEEHGFIVKNKNTKLNIGDKIRIIPNHACAVVNLVNTLYLVKGDVFLKTISVSARGKSI